MGKRDLDSDDESDEGKKPRLSGLGGFGGFSNSAPPPDPGFPDIQLDQMLGGATFLPAVPGDVDPLKPATTPMDFSRLGSTLPSQDFPVPRDMVEYLMTPEHRQILLEESGCDVDWAPDEAKVVLKGSAEQIRKAERLLQRVLMHSNWGRSETKVRRLLKPPIIESAVCRLSPMNTLPPGQKTLSQTQTVLSIGKDKGNDIVIPAQIVSRQHCVLELDVDRGAVYVIDCSTNGTFLNGLRLPPKTTGKVLLSHGDELLLQDPASGDQEFGYVVNIQELNVRERAKLQAPRRLLTTEEPTQDVKTFGGKCNIWSEQTGVAELLLLKHLVLMFSLFQSRMFSEVRHHGPRFQLRFWLSEGM